MRLYDLWQQQKQISEDQSLDEVSMSPGSLAAFANTKFAKGMTIGFEAEMAIEGMEGDEDDYNDVEQELDFDADEVVSLDRNWRQQIERFFLGGEGDNSRRDVERVLEQIDEEYFEWLGEQYQEWLDSDESRDTIIRFLKDYDSDISDEDIEDTVKFKKNNYWGSIESDVREDWEGDNMNDESFQEFMEYREYDTMRGIYDNYSSDITWPYLTEPVYGGGNVGYEEIEMSFVKTTGYKAKVSSGYHSAKREPNVWIFEPDSSIEPNGVELVSPPMPLDEGLKALDDFFAWAKSYGAEANESTGFHMGVSIPEQTMDNIDHLKLILFLGDEYVLKQFGRESNRYTKSSLGKMRSQLINGTIKPEDILANFKRGLNSEAAKITRNLIVPKDDRYVSVNIKNNYIEFRSAGGNYFEKIPEIKNTLLRYVRAMGIAADPEAEKNEYAKKLYKLVSSAFPEDTDTIKYFARYASGTLPAAALKSFVRLAQQTRSGKPEPEQNQPAKPNTQKSLPSGIIVLDPNGGIWNIGYSVLATGERGSFQVRSNFSYSEISDWFRRNYPNLMSTGFTQSAEQRSNSAQQSESLSLTKLKIFEALMSQKQPDPKKIQSGIFDLENKLKAIAGDKLTYRDIEVIIQSLARKNSITQKDLESFFKRKHGVQPYEWLAYLPTPRRPKN